MTATELAPVAANAASEAPAANAPATPVVAPATPAAPATEAKSAPAPVSPLIAAAKSAAESAKSDYSSIKGGEHIRESTLKAYVGALGEHKIDAKTGQALLDKVAEAVKAENDAQVKGWVDQLNKDPDFAPDKLPATLKSIEAAMKLAGDGIGEELQKAGLDSYPPLARWALRMGRLLEKATATDSTATGTSGGEMSETERWRANNPNTIAGLKAIGVNVN